MMNRFYLVALVVLHCLVPAGALAQADTEVAWYGLLTLPDQQLPIVLHIRNVGDAMRATVDSPNQGGFAEVVDTITISPIGGGVALAFAISRLNVNYAGTGTRESVTGVFNQGSTSTPLILKRFSSADPPISVAPATWSGILTFPSGKLRMVLTTRSESRSLVASLYSPDQQGPPVPVDFIGMNGADVIFEVGALRLFYFGSISNGKLSGTYTQNGTSVPMTFSH